MDNLVTQPTTSADNEPSLSGILAKALERGSDVTEAGFERLDKSLQRVEKAVTKQGHDSRKDQRMVTVLLIIGLLATVGVNLTTKLGAAFSDVLPVAEAQVIEQPHFIEESP